MQKDATSRVADMMVFAKVVEAGSLAAAARALGTTRSAASKAVARLERHLGTTLLLRTTRELHPTTAGVACYTHCARVVAEVEEVEKAASAMVAAPRGVLRVTCAVSLGVLLAPLFPRFSATYPGVVLEVELNERVVDLVRGGFDVGVRLGRLADSSLIKRKLFSYRRIVCASPSYLASRRPPRSPADLATHNCLLRLGRSQWAFRSGATRQSAPVSGSFRVDTLELLHRGALAGLGVAMLPSFFIADDLARGRLVPLLESHELEPGGVYAVYPPHRYVSPNVRAFVDFLAEEAGRFPSPRSA